jgi:hypothetical protein
MLNEDELKDAALLVFANKQDQPGAKGAGEISEALKLGELRDRNWSIVACSAVDGRGVDEGMDWLVVRLGFFHGIRAWTNPITANRATRVIERRGLGTACIITQSALGNSIGVPRTHHGRLGDSLHWFSKLYIC